MIKNMKLHLLLSALIISLCSQPSLTAASFTIWVPDSAIFIWQWGMKKIHSQPITPQESERAQHILKISGLTTAAALTTIAGGTAIKFAIDAKIKEQREKEKKFQEFISPVIKIVIHAKLDQGDITKQDLDWIKEAINRDPALLSKENNERGNILIMLLGQGDKENEKNILEIFEVAAQKDTDLKGTQKTKYGSDTTYLEQALDERLYELATFLAPYSDITDEIKERVERYHSGDDDNAALTALWNKINEAKTTK